MHLVTCPSGLSGHMRGLTGAEADILADATSEDPVRTFDAVLSNCWVGTTDWGIYPPSPSAGRPDWGDVLTCDRFYALIVGRMLTYPEMNYDFDLLCRNCKEMIEWSLDLGDLPVKELPPASRDLFKAGNRFSTQARIRPPRDRDTEHEALPLLKVSFKLQSGRGEAAAGLKLKEFPKERIVCSLATRVTEIEGIHANDTWDALKATRVDELMKLLDAFEEVDGGVETGIKVPCANCRYRNEVDLPLEARFFFARKRKKEKQGDAPRLRVGSFRSSIAKSS